MVKAYLFLLHARLFSALPLLYPLHLIYCIDYVISFETNPSDHFGESSPTVWI